ncbi:uncharacterized protein EAE98_004390 [Botrytis deweyae]|uniref:No apical meristem-associated C-terminal domain-containing protein n=1 Tax=Botrytis deweyae TaxID=2478750 RepID=A0ABQ7IRJ9_9HELO|nr:uncharacterized protein EAE98_004390 [Botrytis deweyae]KAF7931654.1 hypothetical protein EAE98_004390 [Botrytis deweyae]
MALYEKYETTWPAMWEIMKADDFQITLTTIEISRAKWTATVKHKAIYADYHLQVKLYYVEKLMWRELFKSHPFPGVKPKPVTGAQPATGESSKSNDKGKDTKNANAPPNLTKEQENSAKAKAIADAAAAKRTAEAEASKAKANADAAAKKAVEKAKATANAAAAKKAAAKKAADKATAEAEASKAKAIADAAAKKAADKAKETADAAAAKKAADNAKATADAEAAKAKAKAAAASSAKPTPPSAPSRLPRPPMLTKQDNSSIPLYAVGPVHPHSAKSWLIGARGRSVMAVEKKFPNVRIQCGTFNLHLMFYAEPWTLKLKDDQKVRDACAECQKFLGAYSREAAKVQPRSKPLFADGYFPTWAATVGYSPAAAPATNAPLRPNATSGTTSSTPPAPQDLKKIDDALESDHIGSWSEEVEAEELDDEVKDDKVEEEWVIDVRIARQKKLIAHHKSKPRFHGKSDEDIWEILQEDYAWDEEFQDFAGFSGVDGGDEGRGSWD